MSLLRCVEINPSDTAKSAVIWLHGLGANGHDFEPIVPELGLDDRLATRFIFPHAPSMSVTVNGGMVMPAWYDILDINIDRKIDLNHLLQSAAAVTALIEREIARGVAPERIVVAGFSQGGAVAYQAALTFPQRLAGLLALSTYFASADSITPHPANADLPVLIQHGLQDPIVPETLGRAAHETLKAQGYPVEYETYVMPHSVHPSQIRAIGRWLNQVLAA